MHALAGRLLERLRSRQAHVGVVGLGYVGLPIAVELARGDTRNAIRQRHPHVFKLGALHKAQTETPLVGDILASVG
jgi:glycine/D-amino acid oxidase-like deaminating enzyme